MSYRNRNFDRNNYGGSISRNVDPWDTSNDWGMRGGGNNNLGGGGGGNNGGGGGGGGNFNQNPSNELAMNLLNLLRNNQAPPSLLDLPQADMRGYGGGYGRNSGGGGGGGGDFDRFDERRVSLMGPDGDSGEYYYPPPAHLYGRLLSVCVFVEYAGGCRF